MKRTFIKKPITTADNNVKMRAKKLLYDKLLAAFDTLDSYYNTLKDEYKGEMDRIYDDLETFVQELEIEIARDRRNNS